MRTSLNVPEDVLVAFDDTWQAARPRLASRSRAVRAAMQEYVARHASLENATGDVVALVSFDYEVIEDLHDVQHEFQDVHEANTLVSQPEAALLVTSYGRRVTSTRATGVSKPCSAGGRRIGCANSRTAAGTSTRWDA